VCKHSSEAKAVAVTFFFRKSMTDDTPRACQCASKNLLILMYSKREYIITTTTTVTIFKLAYKTLGCMNYYEMRVCKLFYNINKTSRVIYKMRNAYCIYVLCIRIITVWYLVTQQQCTYCPLYIIRDALYIFRYYVHCAWIRFLSIIRMCKVVVCFGICVLNNTII